MRINLAINHSVPALPDVIQGLLKTAVLCDVYGRRERKRYRLGRPAQRPLWKLPMGRSCSQSVTTVLDHPKHSHGFLLWRKKQSKPELTDSCGQFLTGDVYKKFAKPIPHLYFILFAHMCCTSFA